MRVGVVTVSPVFMLGTPFGSVNLIDWLGKNLSAE
jgi:hypothetical protein